MLHSNVTFYTQLINFAATFPFTLPLLKLLHTCYLKIESIKDLLQKVNAVSFTIKNRLLS